MYKTCMNCGMKYDLSEKMCPKRKCPECGGKLKLQYTQEELKEIQKQNDDMVPINKVEAAVYSRGTERDSKAER